MAEKQIITSQYIQIRQTPAGVGERIFARLLDYLLMFLYTTGLIYLIDQSVGYRWLHWSDYGLLRLFLLLIPVIFYSLLWEILNRGRSPGKMAFGLRVVMTDGTTPTLSAYLLRWIFLLVDAWCGWIGLIILLLNKNNQRTGDLAAGTLVIKEQAYRHLQVTLDEFNHLSRAYRPTFPQAENLTLEQINTIHEALTRHDSHRPHRLHHLSTKAKAYLQITPNMDDETLLRTLTRDYQYYALEEI
jgi:uncharacterized RDD family membrane protein YckC